MVKKTTIVFPYGCPRSGSTLIQQIMRSGEGYACQKIAEYNGLHPCQTPYGLMYLMTNFSTNVPILVRIHRDYAEIANSFYIGVNNSIDSDRGILPRKSKTTDIFANRIAQTIAREEVRTKRQVEWLTDYNLRHGRMRPFFEFHYNDFADSGIWVPNLKKLCDCLPDSVRNFNRISDYIKKTYNKKSVRPGGMLMRQEGIDYDVAPKKFINKVVSLVEKYRKKVERDEAPPKLGKLIMPFKAM